MACDSNRKCGWNVLFVMNMLNRVSYIQPPITPVCLIKLKNIFVLFFLCCAEPFNSKSFYYYSTSMVFLLAEAAAAATTRTRAKFYYFWIVITVTKNYSLNVKLLMVFKCATECNDEIPLNNRN